MLTLTVFVFLQAVCTLMLCLIILKVQVHGCDAGWFGTECTFKCECDDSICLSNGSCQQDHKCQKHHFGPECQYYDIAAEYSDPSTDKYLIDHSEKTCNSNYDETSVEVTLYQTFRLTWFRIYASHPGDILKFSVSVNENITCVNQRIYKIAKGWVDVTCDLDIPVKSLTLIGELVRSICSIYISGGRNVALKQKATQTGDAGVDSKVSKQNSPLYAVDGIVKDGLCSNISSDTSSDYEPTWVLHLSQPVIVYRAKIYSRNVFQFGIWRYTLETYSAMGIMTFRHKNVYKHTSSVLDIYINTTEAIVMLKFKTIKGQPFLLCEFMLYGDFQCPEKLFGLECEKICTCNNSEVCNPYTGLCSHGCAKGFYGFKCENLCKGNCGDGRCYHRSGNCYVCPTDYFGENCSYAKEQEVPTRRWSLILSVVGTCFTLLVCTFILIKKRARAHSSMESSITESED